MTASKLEMYRGALVGTAIGDSILAPYEWSWTPERIRADMEARGGLVPHEYEPFDFIDPWDKKQQRIIKMGQPTDDSELAAALAQSLIAHPELSESDLYNRLRSFIIGRKSILTKLAYGKGSTLADSLASDTYEESVARFARGEVSTKPSNGSLMRCIPVPLRHPYAFKPASDLAIRQSCVTHVNPRAQAACVAYTVFVALILNGESRESSWAYTQSILHGQAGRSPLRNEFHEIIALDVHTKPDFVTEIEPIKGFVTLSLRIAVWATLQACNFADGIVKVGLLAGDTDTYGAIAGGALGAYFGIDGIPSHWQKTLQGREIMVDLADQLHEIAHR